MVEEEEDLEKHYGTELMKSSKKEMKHFKN